MKSIRRHLVRWLTGALLAGTLALVVTLYAALLDEMNEVLDRELTQVALTMLSHYQSEADGVARLSPQKVDLENLAFVTQVWTLSGQRIFVSAPNVDIPFSDKEGFETVTTHGSSWRVYTDRSKNFLIQAAQPMETRRDVRYRRGIHMADVRSVVDIINRRGDVKFHGREIFAACRNRVKSRMGIAGSAGRPVFALGNFYDGRHRNRARAPSSGSTKSAGRRASRTFPSAGPGP